MLYGQNANGFGWDNVRKCVVAEDVVWQALVQVNLYHVAKYMLCDCVTDRVTRASTK